LKPTEQESFSSPVLGGVFWPLFGRAREGAAN